MCSLTDFNSYLNECNKVHEYYRQGLHGEESKEWALKTLAFNVQFRKEEKRG